MKTRKRILSAEHPSTLTSMANLASTYSDQGQWKEAEELFMQVMETRKRVRGAEISRKEDGEKRRELGDSVEAIF
jgi:hypothetical protein